jgi:hypothetical protein
MLLSGLPEEVADDESLSRFLTQSGHYNSVAAKPSAFLPNPRSRNSSVFRIGNDPVAVREAWDREASDTDRTLHGYAVFRAGEARALSLEVVAEEPPRAHANLENWPWLEDDPELQKARQKEIAMGIASKAELVIL